MLKPAISLLPQPPTPSHQTPSVAQARQRSAKNNKLEHNVTSKTHLPQSTNMTRPGMMIILYTSRK